MKCEITYTKPIYIGECNVYLDYVDDNDFDENDNVIVYKPLNMFIPTQLKELADKLGVEIEELVGIYDNEGGSHSEEDGIDFLSDQLYTITSSMYFGDLCKDLGYDCIIQEEFDVPTYGILNPNNIKILKKND